MFIEFIGLEVNTQFGFLAVTHDNRLDVIHVLP
jgi:hypothetical protein